MDDLKLLVAERMNKRKIRSRERLSVKPKEREKLEI